MDRCSFCEWIPILPWPVWPLAGQSLLGQNVVVGSMMVLLALCGSMPRGVYLGPHFRYKCASPRLSAELPRNLTSRIMMAFIQHFADEKPLHCCLISAMGLAMLPDAIERSYTGASGSKVMYL